MRRCWPSSSLCYDHSHRHRPACLVHARLRILRLGQLLAHHLRPARIRARPAPAATRAQALRADRARWQAAVQHQVPVLDMPVWIQKLSLRGRSPRGRKQNNMTEQERRQSVLLTHDQIEEIASRAADKAIDRITQQVYQQVGRSVINKLMWIIGSISVGAYLWFNDKILQCNWLNIHFVCSRCYTLRLGPL